MMFSISSVSALKTEKINAKITEIDDDAKANKDLKFLNDNDYYKDDSHTSIISFDSPSNEFAFKIDSNFSDDDIISEIDRLYPNEDNIELYFYEENRICTFCFRQSPDSSTVDTDKVKQIRDTVKKDLTEKKMIIAFYDIGEAGGFGPLSKIEHTWHIGTSVEKKEKIEKYLDEKNLQYICWVLETYPEEMHIDLKTEMSDNEFVKIANDVYDLTGVGPECHYNAIWAPAVKTNSLKIEEPSSDEPTTETPQTILGDVNGDNAIDSKDAVIILKTYAENLISDNNDVKYISSADVNGDGKIDSKDAVVTLQYYASKIAGLSVGSISDFLKK